MRNDAIMRPTQFRVEALDTLLRKRKIATMAELMAALGTDARRTVFRKLTQLSGFALDFAESKKLLPYESVSGLWITTQNRL